MTARDRGTASVYVGGAATFLVLNNDRVFGRYSLSLSDNPHEQNFVSYVGSLGGGGGGGARH